MAKVLSILFFLPILLLGKPQETHILGAYVPWYAGSLFSTPGLNFLPNQYNVQPYILTTTNYAFYKDNYSSESTPNLIVINAFSLWKTGITNFLDIQIIPIVSYAIKEGKKSFRSGDTVLQLGFQLYRGNPETWYPNIRFTIDQIFPTGKYENANPNRNETDLTGIGSFRTKLSINFQNTFYEIYYHPVRVRLNMGFSIPSKVRVKGFNTYGGGFNTNGIVFPGYVLRFLLSPEYSINQHWVLTADIIYNHFFQGNFRGEKGVDLDGNPAELPLPSIDQFQLAPAVEYNFTANLGAILGVWFTPFGRNTPAFISGVFSITYEW